MEVESLAAPVIRQQIISEKNDIEAIIACADMCLIFLAESRAELARTVQVRSN